MSTHPELQAEQAYLDHAYERVEELKETAKAAMNDVLDIGRGGTFQARTERDVVVRASMARLEQLELGNQPLCFGRLDEIQGEHFYIGRMGVSGRNQEPLVVDWRAPVAEPFYRATGRFPMGLARRRHFVLQGRKLVGIEDEPMVLSGDAEELPVTGQGALLAALERSRSGRMQDIVATIQGEQDEIIRSPLAGVQVVQGGPGTGKTAVALHRAAYLLYTYRFPLELQGVLVVGPNPVFLRYIGHVLPSLGETGVTLTTVAGMVSDITISGFDTPAAAAVKGDARMARVIARAVRDRQRPLRADVDVPYGPYRLRLTVDDSKRIINAVKKRGGTHNVRRKRIERMVIEALYDKYNRAVERIRSIDPSAKDLEIEDFSDAIRGHEAVREALDRMWPRLHAHEFIHDFFGAKPLIALAGKAILHDDEVGLLYRHRSNSLAEIAWTAGDVALIDEARLLLGPTKPLKEGEQLIPAYGHVVVDEAQDLSPMQLRMLGRRSLGGSVTLVGDIAQATGPWAPTRWADVIEHLPEQWSVREVELTIGYRTPAEAMELAAAVLEQTKLGLTPPRPVRSSGVAPVISAFDSEQLPKEVAQRVQIEQSELADQGGTVGVIAPRAMVDEIALALDAAAITYGTASERALDTSVTLLTADVAKGLEFDSVVVIEPRELIDESTHGLRALYVALTRTTLRLSLLHSTNKPLPEFLPRDSAVTPT